MKRSLTIRLFASIWLIYLAHFNVYTGGSGRFLALVIAVVERGSVNIDDTYQLAGADASYINGHYYIDTNPGVSFLAAPFWSLFYQFYKLIPVTSSLRQPVIHEFLAHFISYSTTTALFAAGAAVLLAMFVYSRTKQTWRAIFAALLYSFASIAFYFSTRLQNNITITFFSFVVFVLVFDPAVLKIKNSALRFSLIGLLLGAGALSDSSLYFFAVIILIPLLQRLKSLTNLGFVVLGAIIPVTALFVYQYSIFGNPFLPAQGQAAIAGNSYYSQSLELSPRILLNYLFFPNIGLLFYAPYAFLAAWYMFKNRREQQKLNGSEKFWITVLCLWFLLSMSLIKWSLDLSFGPRFLLPVMPYICMLVALYFQKKELQIATLFIGIGFLVNLAGAQIGTDTNNIFKILSIYGARGFWFPLLTWLRSDLTKLPGVNLAIIGPFGIIIFLVIALFIIWFPYLYLNRKNPPEVSVKEESKEEALYST